LAITISRSNFVNSKIVKQRIYGNIQLRSAMLPKRALQLLQSAPASPNAERKLRRRRRRRSPRSCEQGHCSELLYSDPKYQPFLNGQNVYSFHYV
jgi:hypothetical protein